MKEKTFKTGNKTPCFEGSFYFCNVILCKRDKNVSLNRKFTSEYLDRKPAHVITYINFAGKLTACETASSLSPSAASALGVLRVEGPPSVTYHAHQPHERRSVRHLSLLSALYEGRARLDTLTNGQKPSFREDVEGTRAGDPVRHQKEADACLVP